MKVHLTLEVADSTVAEVVRLYLSQADVDVQDLEPEDVGAWDVVCLVWEGVLPCVIVSEELTDD